jgi:hypothetical protein
MLEALFSAFFEQGRDLRQIDELVALAGDVGLDPGEARRVLLSGRHLGAVRADRDLAGKNGVVSIPTYVVDGQVIHGAKRPAVIAAVLRHAAERAPREGSQGRFGGPRTASPPCAPSKRTVGYRVNAAVQFRTDRPPCHRPASGWNEMERF